MSKDLSGEIKAVRESQLKLAYYVVGLAVASIGYCTNQTFGKALAYSQIPLGLSIILFIICIVFGLAYIRTLNASMQMDTKFFQDENEIEATELDEERKYDLKMAVYKE